MKIGKMQVSRRKVVQLVLSLLTAFGIVLVLGAVGDADNGAAIEDILGRAFGGMGITSGALLVQHWLGL